MNAPEDFRSMTAATIGKDLLSALVSEIKLMPKVWPKLPQIKQDDIIDRLRARVEDNVKMAVHLLAAQGRTVVSAELDSVTRKDGIKAVFKIASNSEGRHELFDSEGESCLIIIAGSNAHLAGINEIKGEADQRAMDLGHEYHENDGGGMDDNVIDIYPLPETRGLPAPSDAGPTQEELDAAFEEGRVAASEGLAQTDCPVMNGALCIEWIKGWKAWQEEHNTEWWQENGGDEH
ncbi:MAG: cell division protein FtsK [Betaproteobacteria bacterium]|nr:cell division protein FtsK [Betaproteobacteria bacterium]